MPTNLPGPYEVEIKYTVGVLNHSMRINCDVQGVVNPGDLPTAITLETKDGVGVNLDVAVQALVTLISARYHTAVSFDNYDFWRYVSGTFQRQFITTNAIGINGTSASTTNESHQTTFTFRTFEGNAMRLVLLESVDTSLDRVPYLSTGAGNQAIMDYVYATGTWLLARDTSYPIAPLNAVGGQNEAVFKARHR